jgi:AcrR family transcriptional regulator
MVICRNSRLARGQRAIRDEQKDLRREEILGAALRLFRRRRYEAITIAEVAKESRIAKGTVYLYYRTKEAIFLGLLGRALGHWFDALDRALAIEPSPANPASTEFIDWTLDSLAGRDAFLRLMAVMHSVLEQNLELETALQFKRELAVRTARSGQALDSRLQLPAGSGVRLLLQMLAMVIGLQHLATPDPRVAAAMARDPRLALFRIDFNTELRALLTAAVAALASPSSLANPRAVTGVPHEH